MTFVYNEKSALKLAPNSLLIDTARLIFEAGVSSDKLKTVKGETEEIKVYLTQSPQDFWHMYSKGPSSCMAYNSRTYGTQFQWMLPLKLHPQSSLAFHPNIHGVYIKNSKDETIWRAICTSATPFGKRMHYATCYKTSLLQQTNDVNAAVDQYLSALNVKEDTLHNSNKGKIEWEPLHINMDGSVKETYIFPYYDDVEAPNSLKWNNKKHKFVTEMGTSSRKRQNYTYYWGLYTWSTGEYPLQDDQRVQFRLAKKNFRRSITADELQELGAVC